MQFNGTDYVVRCNDLSCIAGNGSTLCCLGCVLFLFRRNDRIYEYGNRWSCHDSEYVPPTDGREFVLPSLFILERKTVPLGSEAMTNVDMFEVREVDTTMLKCMSLAQQAPVPEPVVADESAAENMIAIQSFAVNAPSAFENAEEMLRFKEAVAPPQPLAASDLSASVSLASDIEDPDAKELLHQLDLTFGSRRLWNT